MTKVPTIPNMLKKQLIQNLPQTGGSRIAHKTHTRMDRTVQNITALMQ